MIDLDTDSDGLLSALGRNMRSNLRRGRRGLEEFGQVTMEPHPTPDRVDDVLTSGLALEAAGWKGEAGMAVIQSEQRRLFFADLARVAQLNDWLRLGALYLDGRMVAFQYDLEYAGRQVLLHTTYDESLQRCSPGNVLLWNTLEACIERGVRSYELGSVGGRKAWKLRWTSQTLPRLYVVGFGSLPGGRVAHVAWQGRTRLRPSGGRKGLSRPGAPKQLKPGNMVDS